MRKCGLKEPRSRMAVGGSIGKRGCSLALAHRRMHLQLLAIVRLAPWLMHRVRMCTSRQVMSDNTAIETRTLNIQGAQVYVSMRPGAGSGPALLLINGLGANLELFEPFLDA